ncbi:hypothetical protein PDIG_85770 [Penicillium digitatum PHI26]|uniref:Tyrosinase copper-binding domain-containing protein n=2 Tax=Penicillium digitatum TaxID=36651 RepID=K9F6N3_PEND2|nr:hypothetical protein PDIP_47300 [Penicillium digitatum Pd1]EKV05010.1 hypothetical protein PDIG_85770 [Penicillium digitatum PHI26]EKV13777.1 hypothetical protein PDIP_47300 [Penicillium digitatum Pd1]
MPFNSHEGYNDKNHGPTAKLVYRPPTVPMDYTVFASTNPISKDQNVDEDLNIESVTLTRFFQSYGWTALAGRFGNVPVASFDTLFFLHRCKIDRLVASRQALNFDKCMDKITADNATIRNLFGKEHPVNGKTPL